MSSLRSKLDDDVLDLSLMGLEEVPVEEIALLPQGTNLDLSNNRIAVLPVDFCRLTHVVQLDLSKNQLDALPDDFGSLRNLQRLDLYSNRLERLPVSFGDLKSLKWLDLKNNPLSPALKQAAGDCITQADCAMCARKVVALMQSAKSQLERERERLRQEELQSLNAKRASEERERERIRAEKRAAKERRREEARNRERTRSTEDDNKERENSSTNSNDNGKRENKNAKRRGGGKRNTGWFSWCLWQFLPAMLLSLALFTLATGISLIWIYTDGRLDQKNIEKALPVVQRDVEKFVLSIGERVDKASKPYVKEALMIGEKVWKEVIRGYEMSCEFLEPYLCCFKTSVKNFWTNKAKPTFDQVVKPFLIEMQKSALEGLSWIGQTTSQVVQDVMGKKN